MTYFKNHKPIIDDAQTSTGDVPVIIPVAPNVPCGMVIGKDSKDKHISNGPAINHKVPLTAPTSSTEATASLKEIAKQITTLLSDQQIPQHLFAKKVLNRSQGNFSIIYRRPSWRFLKCAARQFVSSLKENRSLGVVFYMEA